jgi:hypothetical protein
MPFLKSAGCWMFSTAAALSTCFGRATIAWADSSVPPPVAEKSYVMPYFLVVLACALGLMLVCRSSHRTTEIKREFED